MATQTWLDKLLGKIVRTSGTDLPTQPAINFSGSGVSVSDNPATGATDVVITAGSGAPTYTLTGTSGTTTAGDVVCVDPTIPAGTNITRWTPALGFASGGPLSVVTSSHAPGATGVTVVAPGEQTNACAADLGTSTRGDWVTVSPAGRAVRASLFSGGPVLGFCDANGILTVLPRSTGSKTPYHTWNLFDFGASPDADTTYGMKAGTSGVGTPTDNKVAWDAWKVAALAQGAPGRLVIPEALQGRAYYTSAKLVLDLPFPVDIVGGGGLGVAGNVGTIFVCGNLTEQHGGIQMVHSAAGSRVFDIGFTHAQTYAPRTWLAGLVVANANWCPSTGTWNYHFRGVSGTAHASVEPTWPLCWEQSYQYRTNQKIYVDGVYESAGTVYSSIVPPRVATYGTPWRYKTTTEGQTSPSVRGMPYVGPAPKWTAGGTPASGSYVRPTDANWNGMYYLVNVPGTFAGTEGAPWPTTIGPGAAFTNGTVQLYAVGKCMPRTAGLSVVDGGCTWTLDDTSGQFVGNNGEVYDVIPDIRNISLEMNGSGEMSNIFTYNWCGHGPAIHGSNDLGTGSNSWKATRIRSVLVAGDGFRTAGSDAGAGGASFVIVTGARGVSIREDSEIGNRYEACLCEAGGGNQNGRFGYWALQATAESSFEGCYVEGGLAPSRIGAHTLITNKKGSWSFTADSGYYEVGDQNRNTSHSVISAAGGLTWAPNTYVYVGLVVYPTSLNGKRYLVTGTTGNSATSNAGFEPNWNAHLTNGSTFTETGNGAVGTITYQTLGTESSTLQIGSQANPDAVLAFSAKDDAGHSYVLQNQAGGFPWFALMYDSSSNRALCFSRADFAGNGNGDTGGGGWAGFPYGFRWMASGLQFVPKGSISAIGTPVQGAGVQGDVVVNVTAAQIGDPHATHYIGTSKAGVVLIDDVFTGTTPQANTDWVDTAFTLTVTAPRDRVRAFRSSLQTTTSGTNQTLATFGPLTDNATGCFNCEVKAKRNGNHASYLRADVSGNFGRNNGAAPEAAGSTATIQTWGAENSLVALTLDMTVSGNNVLLRINNPPAYAVDWGITAQWDEGKS